MSRFQGYPTAEGVMVLDTITGELRIARPDGGVRVLIQPWASPIETSAPPSEEAPPPPLPPNEPPKPPAAVAFEGDAFDNEVVETFPYPVARTYLAWLREPDPRLRCKLMVDTFASVLKLWALQIASEYLRAEPVRDLNVNKTLLQDLQRPLISAWNILLQRALPVLADARVPPFSAELPAAYNALEAKCRDRFLVSEAYEDEGGATRTKTSRLGKIQALIRYRNGLAHGFNQSPERARRDLAEYSPLLREVLTAARFMAKYPLWYVAAKASPDAATAQGMRLMGANPSSEMVAVPSPALNPEVSPLFLRNEATGDVLPLFMFCDVQPVQEGGLPGLGRDVFLFEGSTKTTLVYLSTTGEQRERTSRLAHWKTLLSAKALDVEPLTRETLRLETLRAVAKLVTDPTLEALVQSGKYLREASVDRAEMEPLWAQFNAGRSSAFVIGGESGIGKSTFLARVAEERTERGDVVLFYRAWALQGTDIAARIVRDLGVGGTFFEELLAALAPIFQGGPQRMFVIVDALNEHPDDAAGLLRSIDTLVQQARGYEWLRIVASVRDSSYRRMPPDARFGRLGVDPYFTVEEEIGGVKTRTPILRLHPLGPSEIERLYEAYRSYRAADLPDAPGRGGGGAPQFRPTTTFAELSPDGSTLELLRSPLLTRLVLAAFHRRALPSDLRVDQAMALYLEHVVVEIERPGGGFPDRGRLLRAMVREMDQLGRESLHRDAMITSPKLGWAMASMQKDSPYVQLLDLGVLAEHWDQDDCYVSFSFDRLLEYLLADQHGARIQSADDALALARRALSFRRLRGALAVIFHRAFERGSYAVFVDMLDAITRDPDDDALRVLVREIAQGLVFRLARARDPGFERLLAAMAVRPGVLDIEVLCEAYDHLTIAGEASAGPMLAAMEPHARALGTPRLLGEVLLRKGRRLQREGSAEAGAALAEAREAFERAGEPQGSREMSTQ